MPGLIVRVLLLAAAAITSWFVAKDAPHFSTVQKAVAVLLITLFAIALAFWLSEAMLHLV